MLVYIRFQADFNPYSAGIDFSHQNLTTNVDPRTVGLEKFIMAGDP